MTGRQPKDLVHGVEGPVVIVSARVAAYLNRRAGLDEFRVKNRGVDSEVDTALIALRVAELAWRESATGTKQAATPELDSTLQWLSTTQVAQRLHIGDRAVRKAITEGRLAATDHNGRYRISREDLEHFKAQRATQKGTPWN